ncbi:MAG: hypothetical protein PHG03_01240 [Bacilli bacterium]|nr:hypothetical protein [Bacilli bacterium]
MINLFTTSGILGDWLANTLNAIGLFLDWILYSLISLMYQVFIAISQVNLFGESTLRLIIDRVFTVLGIAMLFIMAYEIILLIINPDKLTGENGAKRLVTKIITSIVLIVLLPTAFKYMQIFQYNVITSNVIGNIILGGSNTSNTGDDIAKAGTNMALTLATTFFHPVENGVEYTYTACLDKVNEVNICKTYVDVYDDCLDKNDAGALFMNNKLHNSLYLNAWESFLNLESKMVYRPLMSTIVAILALKMIISYCIDIGIRVAKLGFLQISAPIPIAMNITEKNSIFETKWFKSLKDTYLDIFLKLIIIYFAMFTITLVPEVISNMWATSGNFLVQGLATVAVILGILQFAKDGPKLIKDLFDIDLDISIKKKLGENEYAMRGATAISGGIRGFAQGNVGGSLLGAREGWKYGGDIKDPTKIRGAGRMAASDAMRTRQNILDEKEKYTREGFKSYFKEKIGDIKDDYKGRGTTIFDQSLKAASSVEASRNEFSDLLKARTAVGRAEDARDNQHTNIMGSNESFMKEYKAEFARNPSIEKSFKDENGNLIENAQFEFAEYMRKQANNSIDKLKTDELKKIFSDKTNSKYDGIHSQIKSTIDQLKENKHLLGSEINRIITDYNSLGEKRLEKTGIKYNKIKDGDLEALHSELTKVDNADLIVDLMDSKMRATLSDAVVNFKSKRDTAAKEKK